MNPLEIFEAWTGYIPDCFRYDPHKVCQMDGSIVVRPEMKGSRLPDRAVMAMSEDKRAALKTLTSAQAQNVATWWIRQVIP